MASKEKFNQNMKAEIISDEDADKVNGGCLGIVEIVADKGDWYIWDTHDGRRKEKYSSKEEAIKAAKLARDVIRTTVWEYDDYGMPVCSYKYDRSALDDMDTRNKT